MTDASARIIRCNQIVVAAGAWSGRIAEMARIGKIFVLLTNLIFFIKKLRSTKGFERRASNF